MLNIKEMPSQYENKDLLRIQPFYSEEIENNLKNPRSLRNILKNEEID